LKLSINVLTVADGVYNHLLRGIIDSIQNPVTTLPDPKPVFRATQFLNSDRSRLCRE